MAFKKNVIDRGPRSKPIDLLLVYPIWVTSGGRGKMQRSLPPLGILSIAGFVRSHGFTVEVIDMHVENTRPEEFKKLLKNFRPKHVGITVLSAHLKPAHNIANLVKAELPETKVVAGGIHAEAFPEDMLRNPNFDLVCRGDGEEFMFEVLSGKVWSEIKGACYRMDKKVIKNAPRPVEMDLDKYGPPAYDLIEFNNYFPAIGTYRNLPAMNLIMTRGCPGKCNFCNSAKTVLRSRSVEGMFDIIKHLHYTYGIRQLVFYDDTFTANKKRVSGLCQKIIDEALDVTWVCFVRGDMFTEDMAAFMAKAGCHHVLFGIESLNPAVQKKIGKEIDKATYKDVIDRAHRHGIEVRGAFIIGHQWETKDSLETTLKLAIELDLDYFQPSILTPYPGTALFKEAVEKNLLAHLDYDRYGQGEAVLKLEYLQPNDLYRFSNRAILRFYLRPKIVWRLFSKLKSYLQVRDLLLGFWIVFVEGVSRKTNQTLKDWLASPNSSHYILLEDVPKSPPLTYEVKQEYHKISQNEKIEDNEQQSL